MTKRHENALEAQSGACNPSALAIAITEACREVRAEGGSVVTDPAIRLIAHQLAYILCIGELDQFQEYDRCLKECEAKRAHKNIVTAA
jgi:hypothetical protein